VHGLLLQERRWNDIVGDLFGAFPLGIATRGYASGTSRIIVISEPAWTPSS